MELEEFKKFFSETLKGKIPWVTVSYVHDRRCLLTTSGKIILDVSIDDVGGIFLSHYDWISNGECLTILSDGDNLSFDSENWAIDLMKNGSAIVSVRV